MAIAEPLTTSAVLTFPCDGYPKGTTGTVLGSRQGCLVFVPDDRAAHARWANDRHELLVPASFVVAIP